MSVEKGLGLTNAPGHEGKAIELVTPMLRLPLMPWDKTIKFTRVHQLEATDKVRFTFGTSGQPADLAVLGLRSGIYIDGTVDEEIAVLVTVQEQLI